MKLRWDWVFFTVSVSLTCWAGFAEAANEDCQLAVEWVTDSEGNPTHVRMAVKDYTLFPTNVTYEGCPDIMCEGEEPDECALMVQTPSTYHCSCGNADSPGCETYFTANSAPYGGNYYYGTVYCAKNSACSGTCDKQESLSPWYTSLDGAMFWMKVECVCN